MEVYDSSEDLERTKNGASSKGTSSRDNPLQKTIHWTRERTKSFRDTLQRTGKNSQEAPAAKLEISTPRNDFRHLAHVGLNGESFGETGFLNSDKTSWKDNANPEIRKAIEDPTPKKKFKVKTLKSSETIISPNRPQIFRRRCSTETDSEDEIEPATIDTDDLLADVLAVMNTSYQNSEEEQAQYPEISNNRVKPFQRLKTEEETDSDDENEESVVEYSSDGNIRATHTPPPSDDAPTPPPRESVKHCIRQSESDDHETRQKKLDEIVNRFNTSERKGNSMQKNEELQRPRESQSGSENGENFEFDESSDENSEPAENITVVSRRSRSSRKSPNTSGAGQRESIVEQIRSQKVQIVGKKDSVISYDREVML
ncbi:unnamed protein product [Oikopleura dioica]|uniref:CRIB domain-containing protein n=1 Tax=Oikopleura dioica TaxID=34765 RepID=E4XKU2_OIKDI|nr:unnamed protein product [Oikopleura dioica]